MISTAAAILIGSIAAPVLGKMLADDPPAPIDNRAENAAMASAALEDNQDSFTDNLGGHSLNSNEETLPKNAESLLAASMNNNSLLANQDPREGLRKASKQSAVGGAPSLLSNRGLRL